MVKVIAPKLGTIKSAAGQMINVDESFLIATSVVYDAVFVAGGTKSINALKAEPDALHFINQAYKHCKAIAASDGGSELLKASFIDVDAADEGIVTGKGNISKPFIKAIAMHRFWERETARKVPA
jgi:catalase